MEQYLFEEEPRKGLGSFLWQNDNAIIVGRNQNTETELDGDYPGPEHPGGAPTGGGRFTMTWEI